MMHETARRSIQVQFLRTAHCATRPGADRAYFIAKVDQLLDTFLDWERLATEWDAVLWGFTDGWMQPERLQLIQQAGSRAELREPQLRREHAR